MLKPVAINVLVADEDATMRTALRAILSEERDLQVVGEAEKGEEAIQQAITSKADVVIMHIHMSSMDGIEATRHLVARRQDGPRVVITSDLGYYEYIVEAIRAGAAGFVLKRALSEFVPAVRAAARGESIILPIRSLQLMKQFSLPNQQIAERIENLSPRERDVLQALARGQDNASIAKMLFVVPQTIKTHVSSILEKLDVEDRTQAAIAAYEGGFIVPGRNE